MYSEIFLLGYFYTILPVPDNVTVCFYCVLKDLHIESHRLYKVSDLVDSATSCFTDLFHKDQRRSSLFRSWKWKSPIGYEYFGKVLDFTWLAGLNSNSTTNDTTYADDPEMSYLYISSFLCVLEPKKLKGGICLSHHFAVTHRGELLHLSIFLFLLLIKQLLAMCDAVSCELISLIINVIMR